MLNLSKGYTLIEILVVLVLLSFITGMIIVNILPNQKNQLKSESDRLAQVLTQAADYARLSGKKIAWNTNGKKYNFWVQEVKPDKTTEYQPYKSKKYSVNNFDQYQLYSGIEIEEVYINNKQYPIKDDNKIYFSPSGINPHFSIILTLSDNSNHRIELEGLPTGKVINQQLPTTSRSKNN